MTTKQPLDRLRSRKKPVYTRFAIPTDYGKLEARDEAQARVGQLEAQLRLSPGLKDEAARVLNAELSSAKEDLEFAEEELEENIVWFYARSMGPRNFDDLVSRHPPTPEQRQEAKKDGVGPILYNPDTFLPELVTSCVFWIDNPGDKEVLVPLTDEFVKEMQEGTDWTKGEYLQIAEKAQEVNQVIRRVGNLGNGSRRTRGSG